MNEEALYMALLKLAYSGAKNFFSKFFRKNKLTIEEIKKRTQILFIDDEPVESLLSDIRDAGWNARSLNDVNNFDSPDIVNSDIIFIDYKGVGLKLTPTDEGIGLLKALRKKYPEKKILFYSGFAGFIPGNEVHNIADDWISKNSDPYVYIERIETLAVEKYGKN